MPTLKNDEHVTNAMYNILRYYQYIEEYHTSNRFVNAGNIYYNARRPEDEYLLHLLGKLQDTIGVGDSAVFSQKEVYIMNQKYNVILKLQGASRYPDIISHSLSVILWKLIMQGGKRKYRKSSRKNRK
jgi:hypothetical protein